MKLKNNLLIEFGIIGLLTIAAIFNTRLELYDSGGLMGWIFTGLSFVFLPGHIGAMIMTNAADPPALWGVIVGYSIQGVLMAIVARQLTLLRCKSS